MRTCIITGGNSGIGFDVAKRLVCHNYDVVLACRNPSAANVAVDKIKEQYHEASISFMHLDLSSKASVLEFAKCFNESKKNLQLLINNAGIFGPRKSVQPTITKDLLEETFQVNHLGHFFLTLLLLENLKQNSPSRIIMVSSSLHDPDVKGDPDKTVAHLDFDNLMLTEKEGTFSSGLAYRNSKLATILFSKELSRKLPSSCGVTINAMNPGWIPQTGLWKGSSCIKGFFACCCGICGKTGTLDDASDCLIHMSCSDALDDVTGKYFENCKEIQSSQESTDKGVAARLWDFSIDLMKIENEPCVLGLGV